MLKKNCHQVLGSQKSKLTPSELVFKTAGVINSPPPNKERVNIENLQFWRMCFFKTFEKDIRSFLSSRNPLSEEDDG